MNYKIVVDSCGELTEEMKKSGCFVVRSNEYRIRGQYDHR